MLWVGWRTLRRLSSAFCLLLSTSKRKWNGNIPELSVDGMKNCWRVSSTGCFSGSFRSTSCIALWSLHLISLFLPGHWMVPTFLLTYPSTSSFSKLANTRKRQMKSEHLFLIKTSWENRKGLMQAYLIQNLKMELQEDGIWLLKTKCFLFVGKRYHTELQATRAYSRYALCIQWEKKYSVLLSLTEECWKFSSYFPSWPVKAQSSPCINFKVLFWKAYALVW